MSNDKSEFERQIDKKKKDIASQIDRVTRGQKRRTTDFVSEGKAKNIYDLGTIRFKINLARAITGVRTFTGSHSARLRLQKDIASARKAAKIGNIDEAQELLKVAEQNTDLDMQMLTEENRNTRNKTRANIAARNRVERNNNTQRTKMNRRIREIDRKDFRSAVENNAIGHVPKTGDDKYKKPIIAKKIIARSRNATAKTYRWVSGMQNDLTEKARFKTFLGHNESALKISSDAGQQIDRMLEIAEYDAKQKREGIGAAVATHKVIRNRTIDAYNQIGMGKMRSESASERWMDKGTDGKTLKKVIVGVNRGVTFIGSAKAGLRVELRDMRARRKSIRGQNAKADSITKSIVKKTAKTMERTENINKAIRSLADLAIRIGRMLREDFTDQSNSDTNYTDLSEEEYIARRDMSSELMAVRRRTGNPIGQMEKSSRRTVQLAERGLRGQNNINRDRTQERRDYR